MKTLIITVGTRQIGWRCQDGVVRCFGADGDRGHPKHIDQLYAELGLERGYYGNEHKPEYRWSVRHLGEAIYQHCVSINNFSNIELLLDSTILTKTVSEGLDHIILWGTDQPEGTPWNFRRADTLWLTKLMAGKIRQVYPSVEVDVWNPVVLVNKTDEIRQEVEGFILKYALDRLNPERSEDFTLLIQTKGSAPQIANALEICAAALIRQCPVEQLIPVEPSPLFDGGTARIATDFKTVSLGQYFWPVEREQIISAWERGDFTAAGVWLEAHRDRYETIYKLAKYLALAINGEVKASLAELRNWCNSKALVHQASTLQIKEWQTQTLFLAQKESTLESLYQMAWEESLLVELMVKRENYTIAFMQFSQLLERLLYIQCKTERWLQNEIIAPKENYQGTLDDYNAGLGGLLLGWQKVRKYDENNQWIKLLDAIRKLRNNVVHEGKSVNANELRALWKKAGFNNTSTIFELMMQVLYKVIEKRWTPSSTFLLRSLYSWGSEKLKQS